MRENGPQSVQKNAPETRPKPINSQECAHIFVGGRRRRPTCYDPRRACLNMTLTDEIYLTKPQRAIPKDCPQFAAVRELTNNIGTTIMKTRVFNRQYQPLGIKFWSVSVAEGNRISVDSVERRINEISDARYYDTPLWVHLS